MVSWRAALLLGLPAISAPTITAYEFELILERPVVSATQFDDIDALVNASGEWEGFLYTYEESQAILLDLLSSDTLRVATVDGLMLNSTCIRIGDTIRAFTAHSTWLEPYPQLTIVDFLPDETVTDTVRLGYSHNGPCNSWMVADVRTSIQDILSEIPAVVVSFDYMAFCTPMCCQLSSRWEQHMSVTLMQDLTGAHRLWSTYAGQAVTGELAPNEGLEFVSFLNHSYQYSVYPDPNYSLKRGTRVRLTASDTEILYECQGNGVRSGAVMVGDLLPEFEGEEFLYYGSCQDLVPQDCAGSTGWPLVCYKVDAGELIPVWCRRELPSPAYVCDYEHLLLGFAGPGTIVLVDGATGIPVDTIDLGRALTQRTFFETEGGRLNLVGRSSDTILVYQLASPTVVGDGVVGALPQDYRLAQNYPNPFNSGTHIGFYLPEAAYVRLEVLSVLGQRVASLIDRPMKAGDHMAKWNGASTASGVYFYRLIAGEFAVTKKMLLLK